MIESIFQTFLLLAYFDIALISITIAIFAVSTSYLGRESRLSRWRMERRKAKLFEKLKGLQEKDQIEGIKKEIKEAEAEQEVLESRTFFLSWQGAVILPSICFIISFAFAVIEMNSEVLAASSGETLLILQGGSAIASLGALVIGFACLLFVIVTVDSVARKVPMPEFEVKFPDLADKVTLKPEQYADITIEITNIGEEIAEQLQIFATFPNAFRIEEKEYYEVYETRPQDTYPNSIQVKFERDLLHVDTTLGFNIPLIPPDMKKSYEIVVEVCERKIGVSKHRLFIEVVG